MMALRDHRLDREDRHGVPCQRFAAEESDRVLEAECGAIRHGLDACVPQAAGKKDAQRPQDKESTRSANKHRLDSAGVPECRRQDRKPEPLPHVLECDE
jgi:hypothetical protein